MVVNFFPPAPFLNVHHPMFAGGGTPNAVDLSSGILPDDANEIKKGKNQWLLTQKE
jgi:hypothetical protein